MPGTFSYAPATNVVTVTGGTAGAPADFASFVAADRAGAGTSLLAAWSPNSNTKALTYPVRPVELLALLISFVVASKTAETDYIFITGTDWLGNAQTESIDVSAGNGTYVTTKRFRTITNIDCSDNAAGGGTVWANGTVAVTQPIWGVIASYGSGLFLMACRLAVGNGSTSTYFRTISESIHIPNGIIPNNGVIIGTWANATFQSGVLYTLATKTTYGGSTFKLFEATNLSKLFSDAGGGAIYLYSSSLFTTVSPNTFYATRVWNCIIDKNTSISMGTNVPDIYNVIIQLSSYGVGYLPGSGTFYNLNIQDCGTGVYGASSGILNLRNCTFADITHLIRVYQISGAKTLIDCTSSIWDLVDGGGPHTADVYRQYSVNLHLADIAGVNISGATVTLKDVNGTQVFSVSTGADGKITEQLVTHTLYDHTASWALITYNPFTLAITKTGYQDYEDVITIDRKMDLEVAMKANAFPIIGGSHIIKPARAA
jgi:hypothetical protein